MLNLATNILFNRALNASGGPPSLIEPMFDNFGDLIDNGYTLPALEWLIVFGAGLAVFPAFSALYVARERQSTVKTMQLSNGISNPIGLWLGHLLFDSISTLILATALVLIFAFLSQQFYGLGILWFILVLYGIAGTLLAYCMTLVVLSPLSAFAATAAYQFLMFILYIAGYMLAYTFADPALATGMIQTIHFTLSLLSPIASVTRAGIISIDLFSLLCNGNSNDTTSLAMIGITKYGGPILYLVLQAIALFTLLFWVDSGSILFQKLQRARADMSSPSPCHEIERPSKEDVDLEAATASQPSNLLQVLDATKSYGSNLAVDRLTFGVGPGTVFCMVGPNGAGKTTSINLMSGSVVPQRGDILINKASVVTDSRAARISLGVCPQFSAIDAQLSVREHLTIYGRLKGLTGADLRSSIDALLSTTGLHLYADRLAGKLSESILQPPVVLIDEFSTGIDAKIKREMWGLLRTVAASKAFVITTHSMEEAAALATKVGILAVRLLAVGTTDGLSSRYATYEVHFTCRTPADLAHAERLMARIPGARMVDDLATRFEVPIANMPLAELFRTLSETQDQGAEAFPEYTVEKATLESMFLKVIRENEFQEIDRAAARRNGGGGWVSRLFRR
ncbi:P-loop containing nucleoside triphosphate hydrolase protein [Mycena galericulata]|nr:P-loop containing nucleoside triphosphate hydrolase protein [Mycena galericulata]